MNAAQINQAAMALVEARRTMTPLPGLPAGSAPMSVAEAHAIQDETTARLQQAVLGYKAMTPPDGEVTRGLIYAGTVFASHAAVPATLMPQCGVEGEVAFLFRHDLPARATPYTREEVVASVEPLAAIEIVHSRFPVDAVVTALDKLADSTSNGGLVHGAPLADWHGLDLGRLNVTLEVNGAPVLSQTGGHPTGDPLGVVVALANVLHLTTGLQAGQIVTCGSCTGLRYLRPGDTCRVLFEGLGEAGLRFKP